MRIVVHGQQAFGKSVLDSLLEKGEDVIAVYCAPDREGGRPDPLKEAAEAAGLPVYQPASYKENADALAEFKALKPDLCVMAFVMLFVPEEFLDAPTFGSIQYHPSLLPLHRGPSSINWPIIGGATKTGLTIFWPDNGLDTGPVLLQKEIDITDDDTLGSVYFEKLFPLGVDALLEGVDLVRAGDPPRIVQDESKQTYESFCRRGDVEIDWSKPLQEVYNLIRGANPQPGAWTTRDGKTLQIFDCVKAPDASGDPGEIISVGDDGFTVATGGGGILVKRVKADGGAKQPAPEYTTESGLAAGGRLG